MSEQLVRKLKLFWDDADHAIESWLEDMARQGLHLRRVGCLRSLFVFQRGAPQEVTYRTDFLLGRKDPHYVQLFIDAGWEHVDESLGWQYWRAPTREGRTPEIFTDVESQIKKYQRLLLLFALAALPLLLVLPSKRFMLHGTPVSNTLLLVTVATSAYAVIRLLLRIRRLRNREP